MEKIKEAIAKMDKDAAKKMGIVVAIFLVIVVAGALLSQAVTKENEEKAAAEAAALQAKITSTLGGDVARVSEVSASSTSIKSAKAYMVAAETEELSNVIIATDKSFADGLSGTYLSAVNKAPILVLSSKDDGSVNSIGLAQIVDFLEDNLAEDGTITLLGSTDAIPADVETTLGSVGNVTRIAAADRYATNLAVLQAGDAVETEEENTTLLVANGENYADCISAASTGYPILLVSQSLTADQKAYLEDADYEDIYVLGSTAAVPATIETALADYGTVTRISGNDRFETSAAIAEQFFGGEDATTSAVALAYGHDYLGGLSGALLANQLGAPILLVEDDATTAAKSFTSGKEITRVVTFASADQISDDTMNAIK